MILLKSKISISITTKKGVVETPIFAEGTYLHQTPNKFVFSEKYYYETTKEVENPLAHEQNEPETITVTERTMLSDEKQSRSITEIDAFFAQMGKDITKKTGYSKGIETNFQTIFATVVKMNGNYGVQAKDWEIVK